LQIGTKSLTRFLTKGVSLKSILLSLLFFFAAPAFANSLQGFSLGGMVGDPTGISGAYQLSSDVMIDGGLSYSFGGRSGVQIHSDYLRFLRGRIGAGDADLDIYYGIGGRLVFVSGGDHNGKISLGPRAPLGLFHRTSDPNLDFFGEIAAVLDIAPKTAVDLDIAAGLRFRF
jgi:hypothetical protein